MVQIRLYTEKMGEDGIFHFVLGKYDVAFEFTASYVSDKNAASYVSDKNRKEADLEKKLKPPHVHPHPFFTLLQKYIQKHVKSNENRGGMGVRGGPPVRNLTKQLET
jgi:hypothetical protein